MVNQVHLNTPTRKPTKQKPLHSKKKELHITVYYAPKKPQESLSKPHKL